MPNSTVPWTATGSDAMQSRIMFLYLTAGEPWCIRGVSVVLSALESMAMHLNQTQHTPSLQLRVLNSHPHLPNLLLIVVVRHL